MGRPQVPSRVIAPVAKKNDTSRLYPSFWYFPESLLPMDHLKCRFYVKDVVFVKLVRGRGERTPLLTF